MILKSLQILRSHKVLSGWGERRQVNGSPQGSKEFIASLRRGSDQDKCYVYMQGQVWVHRVKVAEDPYLRDRLC